jgi:hypothetical protein
MPGISFIAHKLAQSSRRPPEAFRYRSSKAGSLARGSSNVVKLSLMCRGSNSASCSACVSSTGRSVSKGASEARLGVCDESQGDWRLRMVSGETVWVDDPAVSEDSP